MANRIEKIKTSESWKVQQTRDAKKDKRDQSHEGEKQQENRSSFEEKIDIDRLITKATGRLETLSIPTQKIKNIQFKSISTGREQITVETKIIFQDNTEKEPVFISVSRTEGLKLIHYKAGDFIRTDFFTKEYYLKVSVPMQLKKVTEKNETEKIAPETIKINFYKNKILEKFKSLINVQTVLYGVLLCLLFIFIYLIYRILI